MSPSVSVRLLLTQSDARLVELARAGHERAFEALVERYRSALLGYCRRQLLPHERAEDALQQGLLQAWLALREGVEVSHVRPWLYRIVHNTALNMRRAGYSYAQLSETLCGAGAPAEDLDRRIAVREALAGLAALPEMQREALLHTAVDGSTYQETAVHLGLSESAVRGLVHRARVALRTATTALTPPPLLNWLLGSGGADAPLPSRLAEVGSGGGGAGLTAGLLKLAATAATAGVVVGGVGITHHHRHTGARGRGQAAAITPAGGLAHSSATDKAAVHRIAAGTASHRNASSAGTTRSGGGRARHRRTQPPRAGRLWAGQPTAHRNVALADATRPVHAAPQPAPPAGRGDAVAVQPNGEGGAAPNAGGQHAWHGGRGGGDGAGAGAGVSGPGPPVPGTPIEGEPGVPPNPFGGGDASDDGANAATPGSGSDGRSGGEDGHGEQPHATAGSGRQDREAGGGSDDWSQGESSGTGTSAGSGTSGGGSAGNEAKPTAAPATRSGGEGGGERPPTSSGDD